MKQRIYSHKLGTLNAEDRLNIASLLIKAGYTVRIGKERPAGNKGAYIHYIEFWESDKT